MKWTEMLDRLARVADDIDHNKFVEVVVDGVAQHGIHYSDEYIRAEAAKLPMTGRQRLWSASGFDELMRSLETDILARPSSQSFRYASRAQYDHIEETHRIMREQLVRYEETLRSRQINWLSDNSAFTVAEDNE